MNVYIVAITMAPYWIVFEQFSYGLCIEAFIKLRTVQNIIAQVKTVNAHETIDIQVKQ